jgi:DNA invertase Pin-like site-specific DNA recombinase
MKAAIYARVSSDDQHCELQLTELRGLAERNGWETVEYMEMESTRKRRPELERLLRDAKARRFDVVLCWKLDRFGRSVKELATNVDALDLSGIRFIAGIIDTDKRNPASRLMLNMMAAFAEFERDLIRERTMAGSAEYKRAFLAGNVGKTRHSKSGKNLAPGRPKRIFRRDEAEKLRGLGHSWRAIAKHLGVSATTIRDALK